MQFAFTSSAPIALSPPSSRSRLSPAPSDHHRYRHHRQHLKTPRCTVAQPATTVAVKPSSGTALKRTSTSSSTTTTAAASSSSTNTTDTTTTTKLKFAGIRTLCAPADLHAHLRYRTSPHAITVVKCYASYCAGCRGVAPKYKKIAAAYHEESLDDVTFCQMDYAANEHFCKETLGVDNLPFFAVFKGAVLNSAQAIGWRAVTRTLVDNIDRAIQQQQQHHHHQQPQD